MNRDLRIYKYPLKVVDDQMIAMPLGARILSVQVQGVTPCVWAIVDPTATMMLRRFVIAGTGDVVAEPDFAYVGTVQMAEGSLVWHVFVDGTL